MDSAEDRFEEIFFADIPARGKGGEYAFLLIGAEYGEIRVLPDGTGQVIPIVIIIVHSSEIGFDEAIGIILTRGCRRRIRGRDDGIIGQTIGRHRYIQIIEFARDLLIPRNGIDIMLPIPMIEGQHVIAQHLMTLIV